MAFSFGTPAQTANTQTSSPAFSFGNNNQNQGSNQNSSTPFSFGQNNTNTQQPAAQAKPTFSFGGNTSTNNNSATTQPAFSFGGTNNAPALGGGGLFGQSSTNNAPSGGLFGQQQSNSGGGLFSQPQQNSNGGGTGLFGQQQQQNNTSTGVGLFGGQQQANTNSGLFGQQASGNNGGGLFGQAAPAQSTGGLFGNSTQQPNQTSQTSGLFGTVQSNQQQSGGLFGSTFNTNANQTQTQNNPQGGLFGQPTQPTQQQQQSSQMAAAMPTMAQSVYGQTLSQPQFSWSRSAQKSAQATMPAFSTPALSLTQSRANLSQTIGGNTVIPANVTSTTYGPSQPSSIQDQLLRLKNAWDPTHPDCMFQAYFYNRVGPETASLYTKPDDHKQVAWDEAVAARPDNSVVPVLGRGFSDLQARIDLQEQQIHAYRTRIHEIANKLKELSERHLLHATPKIDTSRRRHLELSRRALQLAAKVQVLKCRGYALRPEEEQLRTRLTSLQAQLQSPDTSGRIEEIWAKMTLLRQHQKEMEEDIKAQGYISTVNLQENDALANIEQVLLDHTNGMQFLAKIVKEDLAKVEAEISKHKSTQGPLEKSKTR